MFTLHPNLITPDDSVIVWRYMNLDRFNWLINSSALYFSKRSQLEDKWEGEHYQSLKEKLDLVHPHNRAQLEYFYKFAANGVLVNCWHENPNESLDMWERYTDGLNGVVIRSSIGSIKNALEQIDLPMNIGRINYFDYDNRQEHPLNSSIDGFNIIEPLFCKRREYSHEQEVRLAFVMPETPPQFREVHTVPIVPVGTVVTVPVQSVNQAVKIDLNKLVEDIVVSPRFEKSQLVALQNLVSTAIPLCTVKQSNIKVI